MEEQAVHQSEVVSLNIQKKITADSELPTEEQKGLVFEIQTMRKELATRRDMITALKSVPKRNVMEEVDKINKIIERIPIHNFTELNDTFYVSAALATQKLDSKRRNSQ